MIVVGRGTERQQLKTFSDSLLFSRVKFLAAVHSSYPIITCNKNEYQSI